MTGSYSPRPALKIESGYLVFHSVQKRFPAFMRCQALHFLHPAEFSETELAATPLEFRNAVARLSATPILGPLEGGVPLAIYLAGRGLEEDFKDLTDEIQEDGQRVFDLPSRQQPILVAFGSADALEDQALNPPPAIVEIAAPPPEVPAATVAAPAEILEPPALAAPAGTAPEPPPAAAVEALPPAAEPVPAVEPPSLPQPEAAQVNSPAPANERLEAAPTAEPVEPTPVPVEVTPQSMAPEPGPEAKAPAAPQPAPVPAIESPTPAATPKMEPPTALALGSDYYALRSADTTNAQAIVWQARRLAAPPEPGVFELLQPTAASYHRLVDAARAGAQYPDAGAGEWAAIRLAMRGSEANLARAFAVLKIIGPRALRLFYPNPLASESPWPDDFPCYVVEWVEGASVTASPAFSEPTGLELAAQILELVQAARSAAPGTLLTDGLRPGRILVNYDARGAVRTRLTDWTVLEAADAGGLAGLMTRLGETLADLFADIRPETYLELTSLGLGKPGDPALGAWDMVSTGTRNLLRRVLRGEFEGDVDTVVADLSRLIAEQRTRWADNDPLWQARLADNYADKLNWLDIAAVKLGNLSDEARARMNQSRVDETTDLVTNYAADQKFYEAVFDLRVANRRFPQESFFRWALMANTVATLSPEGAFKRLRLDEALTLMSIDEFGAARRALDQGVAFFDEVQFAPSQREKARDYVSALAMAAQAMSLADQALADLQENWNVEEAEANLALAEDRLGRYERLAGDLLHGRDALCLQKIAALRAGIAEFYAKHGRYDPYAARRETTEQARRGNFSRLVERAGKLINTDKPADWSAGGLLLDRAATEFPDLWKDEHDRERAALGGRIGARKLAEARQALGSGNWDVAASTLTAAMLSPVTHDEAARLLSALWLYQRGELELQRNDASAALASFNAAGEGAPELQAAAEAGADKARGLGGAAGGDAVGRELGKRFADQQAALHTVVQGAVLAAQEQAAAKQLAALKQAQVELMAGPTSAIEKAQAEQEERWRTSLERFRRELGEQQAAVIKKAEDDQSAQIQKLVIHISDEAADNQKQTLAQFQKETAQGIRELQDNQPDWFTKSQQAARKVQDDQDKKLASTLKTLEETATWLRDSAAKAPAPEETVPAEAARDTGVKDLAWKMEGVSTTLNKLQGRVGLLAGLNTMLLAGLLAVLACGAAYWFLPNLRGRLPSGGAATAAVLGGPTAAGPVPTTGVQAQSTQAPTAAAAEGALVCQNATQSASFYDCAVTNLTDKPQQFVLMIEPNQINGFFYTVTLDGQNVPPASEVSSLAPGASQFPLGAFGQQDSHQLRISLACTSGGGCKTTILRFVVSADGKTTLKNNEVKVSTSYSVP
jgi:hypothetical protein